MHVNFTHNLAVVSRELFELEESTQVFFNMFSRVETD